MKHLNLPVAMSVRKQVARKMSKGGIVNKPEGFQHPEFMHEKPNEPAQKKMIRAIVAKHMNCGGMAKYAKGGLVVEDHDGIEESGDDQIDWNDPDFLSDEEQDHALDLTYPDPDHKEDTEGMGDRGILKGILDKLRSKRSLK